MPKKKPVGDLAKKVRREMIGSKAKDKYWKGMRRKKGQAWFSRNVMSKSDWEYATAPKGKKNTAVTTKKKKVTAKKCPTTKRKKAIKRKSAPKDMWAI